MNDLEIRGIVLDFSRPIPWSVIDALLTQRLQQARERNDRPGMSTAETENLRGEIRCLKNLLALPRAADRVSEPPTPVELA
jgi:hypothetical protein